MTKKNTGWKRYNSTLHSRSRWCGATSEVILEDGQRINVICTRFKEHLTHPKSKDPLKHFDEARRRHWYEASLPPCSSPPE